MCPRYIDNLEIPIGIISISRSLKEKNNEAIIYLLDYRLSLELVACRPEVPTQAEQGETDVFPDYRKLLYRSI